MTAPIQKNTGTPYAPPSKPSKPAKKQPEGSDAKTQTVRQQVGGGCPACGMGVPFPPKGK